MQNLGCKCSNSGINSYCMIEIVEDGTNHKCAAISTEKNSELQQSNISLQTKAGFEKKKKKLEKHIVFTSSAKKLFLSLKSTKTKKLDLSSLE